MKKRKTEGSSMMVSGPVNPDRTPSFVEMVSREFEKLLRQGRISPAFYSQAIDRIYGQEKILLAIYSKVANGLQAAVRFIIGQMSR